MEVLDILKIIGVIILIGLAIWLLALGIKWCIENLGYNYEEYWSTGIIQRLEYKAAWTETYYKWEEDEDGNRHRVKKTRHHPEEHNIWVEYKGKATHFNNKSIFWSLKEGQEIPVLVHDGYNKEGILKHTYITL